MPILTTQQTSDFHNNGYLMLDNALSAGQLSALKATFDTWVEESRQQSAPYGATFDGRPRFDIESGHNAKSPALRRVASPIDLSEDYLDAMRNNQAIVALSELYSPNLKFHHCKINSKLPDAKTTVKYHQDFMFEPHSNFDLATVLFFLDDVTLDNGPLQVVPGSHKGQLHSLWKDGVFTGAVTEKTETQAIADSESCTGKAGSACIMHTRLLHGSSANHSPLPRTLFIVAYSAEDAHPLSANPLPTKYAGEIVAGIRTNRVRSVDYDCEIPEVPSGASFFTQQSDTSQSSN